MKRQKGGKNWYCMLIQIDMQLRRVLDYTYFAKNSYTIYTRLNYVLGEGSNVQILILSSIFGFRLNFETSYY